MADKKIEKKPVVDPKKQVELIELEHLEDVVGGFEDSADWGGPNRRMSTDA